LVANVVGLAVMRRNKKKIKMGLYLDELLSNLPFSVVLYALDFKPRFIMTPQIKRVVEHLGLRYCKRCGEYIDIECRGKPKKLFRHLHFPQRKFSSKKYRYDIIYPHFFTHLTENNQNHVSAHQYKMLLQEERQLIQVQMVVRIRSPKHYYNFSKLLRETSRRIIPMFNVRDYNMFSNPQCFTVRQFMRLNPTLNPKNMQHSEHIQSINIFPCTIMNVSHQFRISNILVEMMSIYLPHDWLFYYHGFLIDHPKILWTLIKNFRTDTINVLLKEWNTPSSLWIYLIERDVSIIEDISERKLKSLYGEYRSFFHSLFKKHYSCKYYFELYDPIQETFFFRNYLIDNK